MKMTVFIQNIYIYIYALRKRSLPFRGWRYE